MNTEKISPFGKEIKKRLVDMERTQTWLIEQVKGLTGMYFDRSYLYKIMAGKIHTPVMIECIKKILDLPTDKCA